MTTLAPTGWTKEFIDVWPVPDEREMGEIGRHVQILAESALPHSVDQALLIDLYRAYVETVNLFVKQFGLDKETTKQ
jgi:hypothetical protein